MRTPASGRARARARPVAARCRSWPRRGASRAPRSARDPDPCSHRRHDARGDRDRAALAPGALAAAAAPPSAARRTRRGWPRRTRPLGIAGPAGWSRRARLARRDLPRRTGTRARPRRRVVDSSRRPEAPSGDATRSDRGRRGTRRVTGVRPGRPRRPRSRTLRTPSHRCRGPRRARGRESGTRVCAPGVLRRARARRARTRTPPPGTPLGGPRGDHLRAARLRRLAVLHDGWTGEVVASVGGAVGTAVASSTSDPEKGDHHEETSIRPGRVVVRSGPRAGRASPPGLDQHRNSRPPRSAT